MWQAIVILFVLAIIGFSIWYFGFRNKKGLNERNENPWNGASRQANDRYTRDRGYMS